MKVDKLFSSKTLDMNSLKFNHNDFDIVKKRFEFLLKIKLDEILGKENLIKDNFNKELLIKIQSPIEKIITNTSEANLPELQDILKNNYIVGFLMQSKSIISTEHISVFQELLSDNFTDIQNSDHVDAMGRDEESD